MTTYDELRLRIDRGASRGSYRVLATGPAGEALGRFKLPFSDMELENFILKLGSPRRGRRRIDSPEMQLAKGFGTKLFDAVFEGDVRELYRSSFAAARGNGRGLRVSMSLTGVPELLEVPWEYLYDQPSFLSISTWTPVVRYLDLSKPRRPLEIDLPLRILGMVSAPSDAEWIDVEQERRKLETALGPLKDAGAVEVDWVPEANLRALQRQLRKAEYHVFHFIGHGGYDEAADDGVLLFEDEQGHGRQVSGIQLGTMLADEVSLRLAILNACEGGRSSLQDPFSGVATSLIEREIPAVIGMQFEITDRAAIVFASEFYAALADGLPVDSSVAEARKAIYADRNDIEWGTPVLFMRVPDGRLFDVAEHASVREAVAMPVTSTAVAATVAEPEPRTAPPAPPLAQGEPPRQVATGVDVGEMPEAAEAARAADPIAAPQADPARATSDVPPWLPRAVARAAVGAFFGALIGLLVWLILNLTMPDSVAWPTLERFPGFLAALVVTMVAIVALAEYRWRAVRVPDGTLYQAVGGKPIRAAAMQGAIAGATVGFAVRVLTYNDYPDLYTLVASAISGGFGFAIAEGMLRWFERRRASKPDV